jgi:hypothetical protein
MIKKCFLALMITLTLGLGIVRQSRAATIVLFPAIGGAYPGIITMIFFGGIAAVHEYAYKYHGRLKSISWGYIALGLVMDAKSEAIQFQPLSAEDSQKLKLTAQEFESYDSELSRVNALMEVANLHISQAPEESRNAVANEFHETFKEELSPDTLSAIQKIVSENIIIKK